MTPCRVDWFVVFSWLFAIVFSWLFAIALCIATWIVLASAWESVNR